MKKTNSGVSLAAIALGLALSGCAADSSRYRRDGGNRTADHTGSMSGSGGTKGSGELGTGSRTPGATDRGTSGEMDPDRRNRTGMDTGMSSKSGTTGGGTSLSGTERRNDPHRRDR
jgi:hypothetical protein